MSVCYLKKEDEKRRGKESLGVRFWLLFRGRVDIYRCSYLGLLYRYYIYRFISHPLLLTHNYTKWTLWKPTPLALSLSFTTTEDRLLISKDTQNINATTRTTRPYHTPSSWLEKWWLSKKIRKNNYKSHSKSSLLLTLRTFRSEKGSWETLTSFAKMIWKGVFQYRIWRRKKQRWIIWMWVRGQTIPN